MRAGSTFVAGLLLVLASGSAHAMSARELLRSCDAALRSIQGSGDEVSIAPAGRPCWNYMEAVQDIAALADENGGRLLGACLPQSGRTDDLLRIFTKYARSHSDELDTRASVVVLRGLWQEYSCK